MSTLYTPFRFKSRKCLMCMFQSFMEFSSESWKLEDISKIVLSLSFSMMLLQHVEHLERPWARKLCPCKVTTEGPHRQTCSSLPFCHQSSDGSWDTEQSPAQIWLQPLQARPHDTTYTLAALSRIAPDHWVQRSAKP